MLTQNRTTTMPINNPAPRTPPGSPFQDLLRRTRALGTHPLAWPAVTSFAALAILSFGTPTLAHHTKYSDFFHIDDIADPDFNHPLADSILPTCTAAMLAKFESFDDRRSWTKNGYTYRSYDFADPAGDGTYTYYQGCHDDNEPENHPPVVKQSIQDRALAPDSGIYLLSLSAVFKDPDGDPLTYTATSSDTDMVTVAVRNDETLALIPVAKVRDRRVVVRVTASDGKGGTVSTSFTVLITGEVDDSGNPGDGSGSNPGDGSGGSPGNGSGSSPGNGNSGSGAAKPEEKPFLDGLAEELVEDVAEEVVAEVAQTVVEKVVEKVLDKLGDKASGKLAKAALKGAARAVPYVGTAINIYEIYTILDDAGIVSSEAEFNRLAEAIYIHQEALENGTMTLAQALSGQNFTVPLSIGQSTALDEDPASPPGSGSGFNAFFSGNVQFSRFDDSSGDFEFDGSTTAYSFGLDVFPRPGVPLVTGLQLAFTSSNADYEDKELDIKGAYELRMVTVHPTIAWDASDNLTLWASLGYGRGETELTIKSIADDIFNRVEGRSSTDNDAFFSFAGGANVKVWQSDASALTIKVDGSTASFMDDSVQQGRIAAQFSRDITLNGGRLRPSADLALLFSSSDATAAELTGGLSWLPDESRLSGSTSARVLLFGDDRSEWGIGGSLSLLAGPRGEGLSVALQPSFGQSGSTGTGLNPDAWDLTTPADLALGTTPLTGQLRAELGYGFRTPNALLTPYTQLNMAHSSTTATAGLRYQLDSSLDLDFSASHRSRSSGNNDSRVFLQLRKDL